MNAGARRPHVSLLAIPEAMVSTLSGIYDVLNFIPALGFLDDGIGQQPPFKVEIVGEKPGPMQLASGIPLTVQRGIDEVPATDIVIVPSLLIGAAGWESGRYAEIVAWLGRAHARGATLCSACSGIFILAETGAFDGHDATIHWATLDHFRRTFPRVALHPERALIAAGERENLVSSGASASWHDLVLYLIARHVGPTTAQAAAKFFALQWHQDGLAPYIVFGAPLDHGDGTIEAAQAWLAGHFSVAGPVEEMVRRSGIAERSFKRRFTKATGHTPIGYVQRLRIEDGKRRLERTTAPVDEIAWQVGYEDPAFFRRLFKRTTGISPGAYRQKFRIPDFAVPAPAQRAPGTAAGAVMPPGGARRPPRSASVPPAGPLRPAPG